MKLNLLINSPSDIRSGYVNVDAAATPETKDGRVHCNLASLEVADAGECSEIVAHDVLDAFPVNKVDEVLSNWLSKLAHKGRLALSVVDLREVSRAVISGNLTAEAANLLLHGESYRRQCSFTAQQLSEVLSNRGYAIKVCRVENYHAIVVAERP